MTKLWGIKSGDEIKPNWLTDTQKENTYATNAGWTQKHSDGTEEVLVAIANLKTKLGAASVTEIAFASGTYTAGTTKTLKVSFNEKVTVTGTPTISISTGGTAIDATYASTSTNGNVLTFSFTVPVAATVMSIVTQSIALAGGTITETGVTPTVNADLVITTSVASKAGTKTAV